MNRTSIEWCRTYAADGSYEEGFSVNPVRFRPTGSERLVTMCQKVSPGCAHCYAETISRRFWPKDAAGPFPGYTAQGALEGEFVLDEKALFSVFKRKKPARIFWGDMTDLFQESVPDAFLDKCFAVAALTPHLTHMFLTKRADRMLAYFEKRDRQDDSIWLAADAICAEMEWDEYQPSWPIENVRLGVSAENQEQADKRIPLLLQTPAAVRFLSAEPLLGPMNVEAWLIREEFGHSPTCSDDFCALAGGFHDCEGRLYRSEGLDLVIVGGESGAAARPMHPGWACDLRDQCEASGTSFFFKQWGEWLPLSEYSPFQHGFVTSNYPHEFAWRAGCKNDSELPISCYRVGKKAAGRLLDGREWNEFPGSAEHAGLAQRGVLGRGELEPEAAAAVRDGGVEGLAALEGAQPVAALGQAPNLGLGISAAEPPDRSDGGLQVGLEEVHDPALAVSARRRRSAHKEAHVDPHAEIVGGRR